MKYKVRVRVMVLNATFNNISAISSWSVLLVEEIRLPSKNSDKLDHIMLYNIHLTMNGIRTNISGDRH